MTAASDLTARDPLTSLATVEAVSSPGSTIDRRPARWRGLAHRIRPLLLSSAAIAFAIASHGLVTFPTSAAAAELGPGYQSPGHPLDHLGAYIAADGTVTYCIDVGKPSTAGAVTTDAGTVRQVNGLEPDQMLELSFVLAEHGTTTDARTAAAVAMVVWGIASGDSYRAIGGDAKVLQRAPGSERAAIQVLADRFRADADRFVPVVPTAAMTLSIRDGDDYAGYLDVSVTPATARGTVSLGNAVFADSGLTTRSDVTDGAHLAIIGVPPDSAAPSLDDPDRTAQTPDRTAQTEEGSNTGRSVSPTADADDSDSAGTGAGPTAAAAAAAAGSIGTGPTGSANPAAGTSAGHPVISGPASGASEPIAFQPYRVSAKVEDFTAPGEPSGTVRLFTTPGAQTLVAASASAPTVFGASVSDARDREVPTLATIAQATGLVGGTIRDSAIVEHVPSSGLYLSWSGYLQPAASDSPICTPDTVAFETDVPLSVTADGTYPSADFVTTDAHVGTMHWVATLVRDGNVVAQGRCGDPTEMTVISPVPPRLPIVSG